jgi:hypothetical protein
MSLKNWMVDSELKQISVILVFTVFATFVYRSALLISGTEYTKFDFMEYKLFGFEFPTLGRYERCCRPWGLSHILLFGILGFFFPDHTGKLFGLGILWELFEVLFFHYKNKYVSEVKVEDDGWLYGAKSSDIIYNGVGLFLGWGLNKIITRAYQ